MARDSKSLLKMAGAGALVAVIVLAVAVAVILLVPGLDGGVREWVRGALKTVTFQKSQGSSSLASSQGGKQAQSAAAAGRRRVGAGAAPQAASAPSQAAPSQAGLHGSRFGAHPSYLVDGSTANSDAPMVAAEDLQGVIAKQQARGEGPQTDAKLSARAALNLSDGRGIQIPAEMMAKIETAADFEALLQADPKLAREFSATLERVSQRADTTGIRRQQATREEVQQIAATTSGVSAVEQGHFPSSRSGAASATSPERFASAIGETNLQNLSASRSQYDSLIASTLVAPQDDLKQAALIAMIQKVTDPAQRARLMAKVTALSSAIFKDADSAEQALADTSSGYMAFADVRPARGFSGSLGSRYSFGDGGDLAPILLNYPTVTTVDKDSLLTCGFATHQAYEFAAGRDFGGF
jgi:hypothetical protein